jgi:putative chitinase
MITLDQLSLICATTSRARLSGFIDPLNRAMVEFVIETPLRQAAFLAQVSHESGGFYYVKELASGRAYEGRKDLGNIFPGDGVRYKGRGLIQVTGRANYAECSKALGEDFIKAPELLERPVHACRSAAWFWSSRGLNELADERDFRRITRRINGGYNGLEDRLRYYALAECAVGVA